MFKIHMKIIEAWQRDVNDVTWESIFILGKRINPAEYGILLVNPASP